MRQLFLALFTLFFLMGCSDGGGLIIDSTPDQYQEEPQYSEPYTPENGDTEPQTDPLSDYYPQQDETYTPVIEEPSVPSPQISPVEIPPFRDFNSLCGYEPLCYQQWYLAKNDEFYYYNDIDKFAGINAGDTYDKYSGSGVVVAIIDDALDIYHSEFSDRVIATYNMVDGSSDVMPQTRDDIHGTEIAGIIASSFNKRGVVGIATDVKIIFIKIGAYNSESDYIEAFQKADELGADIICNSWGTYHASDGLKDAINNLAQNGRNGKGTIIIFAAGNDGKYMGNDESAIPSVLGVGASNKSNDRTSYSNFGDELDILAPGGDIAGIATTDISGSLGATSNDYVPYDDYNKFLGTSAAAPIVTGAIALLLEANPNLSRTQVFSIIRNSADKIGDVNYDYSGHNEYYGYGKLNLYNAIRMATQ